MLRTGRWDRQTSLHKCWLRQTENQSFTLSRLGPKTTVAAFTGSPTQRANHWDPALLITEHLQTAPCYLWSLTGSAANITWELQKRQHKFWKSTKTNKQMATDDKKHETTYSQAPVLAFVSTGCLNFSNACTILFSIRPVSRHAKNPLVCAQNEPLSEWWWITHTLSLERVSEWVNESISEWVSTNICSHCRGTHKG